MQVHSDAPLTKSDWKLRVRFNVPVTVFSIPGCSFSQNGSYLFVSELPSDQVTNSTALVKYANGRGFSLLVFGWSWTQRTVWPRRIGFSESPDDFMPNMTTINGEVQMNPGDALQWSFHAYDIVAWNGTYKVNLTVDAATACLGKFQTVMLESVTCRLIEKAQILFETLDTMESGQNGTIVMKQGQTVILPLNDAGSRCGVPGGNVFHLTGRTLSAPMPERSRRRENQTSSEMQKPIVSKPHGFRLVKLGASFLPQKANATVQVDSMQADD
jgi:hypothetical protein